MGAPHPPPGEIQIELLVPFQRGASLKRCLVIARNVADYYCICRPLDSVLFVFSGQKPFWKHLHLPLAYSLSSVFKQSARYFQSHRVNTTPFENLQTSPLKLSNKKNWTISREVRRIRLSNLFGDVLSRSFNVIGQLMKKCWLLLFSIKAVIGQFSSKWPRSK